MKCLQLWMPLFGRSLGFSDAGHDMRAVFEFWDCHLRIWVLPKLKKPETWIETIDGNRVLIGAVPGEDVDCFDIFHVGENGYVYGHPQGERFKDSRVNGLLDAWLSWLTADNLKWQEPPPMIVDVPEIRGEQVGYRQHEYRPPSLPVQHRGVMLKHRTGTRRLIENDAEAAAAYARTLGALTIVPRKGLPPVMVSSKDPGFRALAGVLYPPEPLTSLFQSGISYDALFHCVRMMDIARRGAADATAALQRALVYSAPYISAGMSRRQLTWFLPRLVECGVPDAVVGQGERLGLTDARSFSELKDSEPWRKAMTEPVPVQRVWGPIGLFWSLLIERLESRQPLKSCERCGRPLKGTRAKRFCSQNENLECFHRRRATDRRRERASDATVG